MILFCDLVGALATLLPTLALTDNNRNLQASDFRGMCGILIRYEKKNRSEAKI